MIPFRFLGSAFLYGAMLALATATLRATGEPTAAAPASLVLGLAVDAPRGHLCAVSTNGFLEDVKVERRNAVVRYDLQKWAAARPVRGAGRAPAKRPRHRARRCALCDVLHGRDGVAQNTGRNRLHTAWCRGRIAGANGIALGTYGLYVAVSTGIMRIETATGEATKVVQPDHVMTGGIDVGIDLARRDR